MMPSDPEATTGEQQINSLITSRPFIGGSAKLWQNILDFVDKECTFYRVHLLAFTFAPLIASGIFYGSNGRYHVPYLDSLFLCYSAMTVTGLSSVNLSTLTVWQQVMIYFLMLIGDITTVSWIMVLVRKRFFRNHCEYIVAREKKKRHYFTHRSRTEFIKSIATPIHIPYKPTQQKEDLPSAPVITTNAALASNAESMTGPTSLTPPPIVNAVGATPGTTLVEGDLGLSLTTTGLVQHEDQNDNAVLSIDGVPLTSSPIQNEPLTLSPENSKGPRVDFAVSTGVSPRSENQYRRFGMSGDGVYPRRGYTVLDREQKRNPTLPGTPFPSTATDTSTNSKYRGFGQFPGPLQLLGRLAKRAAPKTYKRLQRTMTMPSPRTLEGQNVPYLDFDLSTGRNSDFHTESLSDEQLELLGGTEYRALRWLSYVVPLYLIGTQLLPFLIFGSWIAASHRYNAVFEAQPRLVNKGWFAFFQVMAAYTGGGLSLVDQGMVPFQTAYLMIFPLIFAILAGNHALPVLLRFVIWICSKIVDKRSHSYAALSFLLDHPRRCFLYLFPSHQTWFLLFALILFSTIEWVSFAVLNNGLSVYETLPTSVKAVGGLFQGIAARASGFSIVPLASFAPSLLFLYVVMMYIAVYPVAMSIRSTNVYEERSLGVYDATLEDEDEEPQGLEKIRGRRERVGKYLYWHLRRQMSIDIWWLVWAVFLVAIIERNNLMDEEKKWFDLFRVIFELVSAFGGIGLSLGFPDDNFSFVGAMRPLSKLVVIVIMVRGRHRGLPVAIDRAIVLPRDMVPQQHTGNLKDGIQGNTIAQQEPRPLYSDFGA